MSASRRDPPRAKTGFLGLAHLRRMRNDLLGFPKELARTYGDLVGVRGLRLLIAIGAFCAIGCEQCRGLPVATKKCRRIAIAIQNYDHAYGHIPYDGRGPEYALYALNDLIDVGQFQLRESSNAERPRWDHESKRLIGGDVVYINQPLTASKDWGEKGTQLFLLSAALFVVNQPAFEGVRGRGGSSPNRASWLSALATARSQTGSLD